MLKSKNLMTDLITLSSLVFCFLKIWLFFLNFLIMFFIFVNDTFEFSAKFQNKNKFFNKVFFFFLVLKNWLVGVGWLLFYYLLSLFGINEGIKEIVTDHVH